MSSGRRHGGLLLILKEFARGDASWSVAGIGDFNADARTDILWRNDNGALAEWLMNGNGIIASVTPSSGGSAVAPDASWNVQAKPTVFG